MSKHVWDRTPTESLFNRALVLYKFASFNTRCALELPPNSLAPISFPPGDYTHWVTLRDGRNYYRPHRVDNGVVAKRLPCWAQEDVWGFHRHCAAFVGYALERQAQEGGSLVIAGLWAGALQSRFRYAKGYNARNYVWAWTRFLPFLAGIDFPILTARTYAALRGHEEWMETLTDRFPAYVYADYLEEIGDDIGEGIRRQLYLSPNYVSRLVKEPPQWL